MKRPKRARRCPTGKRALRTELDAKIALAEVRWRDKGQQRYYRCGLCKTWHLTSQEKRVTA